MTDKIFQKELMDLEQRFAELQPEYELSVFDRKHQMQGYLVVWNTVADELSPLGRCAKGGTRITPALTLDEVRMLAKTMALKNAAAGLPLGGAKSGLRADPDAPNFEQRYKCFIASMKNSLKEFGGLYGGFGFDIGARPIHPRWAIEVLGSGRSFTGKPLELGGTDYDKEGLAGFGVAIAARTWLEVTKQDIGAMTFSVQGLGAMGAAVVKYFTAFGAKPLYISDPRIGGTYRLKSELSKELIDSIASMNFSEIQSLLKYSAEEKLELDQVLYQKTDLLFPCAIHDVILASNVDKISAVAVIEGANGPCSNEARTVMYNKGITVIPDFVANPGGIIAAYVEMISKVSPADNLRSKANVIMAKELIEERITQNVKQMISEAQNLQIEPVLLARSKALKKILG